MSDPFLEIVEKWGKLTLRLIADVTVAEQQLCQSDTPYNRRVYVRSVFAWFEGEMFQWRRLALYSHDHVQERFEEAEVVLLREHTYRLDKKGRPHTNTNSFLPLIPGIRFSFAMFTRALGMSYELDVGGQGWKAFQEAVIIRNQVTHPKDPSDLEITDSQLEQVKKAVVW